ncbi:MAG: response regulator [Candidatus Marinimicrobia bacterium]|nr:response regulator [Candidatus Neomarinimicrobiota bacterium]
MDVVVKKRTGIIELTVYVRDIGRGISKEEQKIIFEHFRQAEEENFNEGTGLGLSICKGIVELLGGRIWLESEPGKGSCFYFTLSLERAENIDKNENRKKTPVPELKNKEIIIAEDDPSSYYLINMYLWDTGAVLRFAADGVKLMNMLEDKLPDLLLLDINLPEIDGYTCLGLIREKGYSLKIIAQTAYAMQNDKQQCLSAGCHGYVAKPFDQKTLLAEIVKVLSDTPKT